MPHQLGQSRNTVILVQPVLLGADGGDGAAVDEQVRAGDEAGVIAQKERARLGDFVGGATALGGRGAVTRRLPEALDKPLQLLIKRKNFAAVLARLCSEHAVDKIERTAAIQA